MKLGRGKFQVTRAGDTADAAVLEKDGLVIGRLQSCDVVLNHKSVSRIHAGINFLDDEYFLINLSVSNSLSLNGKVLGSEEADVLADGDIIQIGPYTISVSREQARLSLFVSHQFTGNIQNTTGKLPGLDDVVPPKPSEKVTDVLKVFWEKRTRDKDEWGTDLRPQGNSRPGKALINWKPTQDLRSTYRIGLFIWVFLIFGTIAAFAFFRMPAAYAPKPLSNPHGLSINSTLIANRSNESSCTTCHTWNRPMATSCVGCHKAEEFHASNTKYHADAGITCTTCHLEHQGENFDSKKYALESCSNCHNDNNRKSYNGRTVRTAHGGSFGYPVENGNWTWTGLHTEIAEAMLAEIMRNSKSENARPGPNEQFHAVHMLQLRAEGIMKTDAKGAVSCTSCHNSFDPIDRATPRQTCGHCHNGMTDRQTGEVIIPQNQANCVSCHVQHPYSRGRWREHLNSAAEKRRSTVVGSQIIRLNTNRK